MQRSPSDQVGSGGSIRFRNIRILPGRHTSREQFTPQIQGNRAAISALTDQFEKPQKVFLNKVRHERVGYDLEHFMEFLCRNIRDEVRVEGPAAFDFDGE